MRKTVNVNIGSLPFTIDDNAYEALSSYLDDIESRLAQEDSDSMRNIEVRIARLFDNRLGDERQVIDLDMVKEAMALIGTPASFGRRPISKPKGAASATPDVYVTDEDVDAVESIPTPLHDVEEAATADDSRTSIATVERSSNTPAHRIPEREPYDYPTHLYRSRDNRVIAGVCGGIAKYANIAVNKVRVVFVILTLIAYLALIVYFILWYIVPEEPLRDINGNIIDTSAKKQNDEVKEE